MIVARIWRAQPGNWFCVSTKSASKKWKDNFFERSRISEVAAFIDDHRDKDIYFCPHGFTEPHRRKEFAVAPRLLWSDLDEVDPGKVKVKPTIALESSPGRYVGLWLLDETMTEVLNRRLSYAIEADRSGWDFTQVLRVPGTINYKYKSLPRTKILWSDGPTYKLKALQKTLPRVNDEAVVGDGDVGDSAEVYKTWENRIPHWCRRALNSKDEASVGKRSEMLWKIEQTLIEIGMSRDEAFILVKASSWNKFAGRRSEDSQLKRELDKAVNKHMGGNGGGEKKAPVEREGGIIFRNMDEVEEEDIDWIYYPYLARGEVTIIEGDPGLGKSYLSQMICAHINDGKAMPSVKKMPTVSGKTVYFDMENSAGSVTKKRLIGNGLKHLERFVQCEEPFSIDDEDAMDEIYDWFEKHRPIVGVFDTMNTYLGKADSFKGPEAQQAFMRWRELAMRFRCSVVILRHLTKSGKERALYRGQGNISFAGVARVIITVGTMPGDEDDTRVMAVTKLNVARIPKALTFSIHELPDTLKERDRSKFEWGEFVDLTSEDILKPEEGEVKGRGGDREAAKEFLEAILEEGPVELRKLERMAQARSISEKALRRAADELGVKQEEKDRRAIWRLDDPPADDQSSTRRHRRSPPNGSRRSDRSSRTEDHRETRSRGRQASPSQRRKEAGPHDARR